MVARSNTLLPTNEDTIGPYFPLSFCDPYSVDLTKVHEGLSVGPAGRRIVLTGRILDRHGAPAAGALLEFWQANASGRCRRPGAESDPSLDPWFDGFTRMLTPDGSFVLKTVMPGGAPQRAPHVTLAIFSDGIARVVTQIFLEGERANAGDPLLAALPPELASRLTARRDGPDRYAIDIVMAGDGETPFFDDLDAGGRQLGIGPTDNTSDQRTPRQRLRPIPEPARASFVPYAPLRIGLKPGEDDLTRIAPGRPLAAGEAIEVMGTVRDADGRPLRHALIEIWNANARGRYTHIEDRSDVPLDPNFLGVGRAITDAHGAYRFRTISPGAYLARPDIGRWRPKHIHLSLIGGGARLVTQMYFAGDAHNDRDPMRILMGDAFERNIGVELPAPTGDVARAYRFDIVVGGRNATFFEQN